MPFPADPNADLLGDVPAVVPTGTTANPGALAAMNGALEQNDEAKETERKLVKKALDEYTAAREFDKDARKGYARDRAYADGSAQKKYASDANLIGSFIDVLVSFLYAKNPDVGARAAPRVVGDTPAAPPMPALPPPLGDLLAPQIAAPGLPQAVPPVPGAPPAVPGVAPPAVPGLPGQVFSPPALAGGVPGMPGLAPPAPQSQSHTDATRLAETLQIVISRLWKDGRLKKCGKKSVRSSLSVGPGWFKALMFSQKQKDPQVEKSIRDLKSQLDHVKALQDSLAENTDPTCDYSVKQAELELAMQGAERRLMKIIRAGMTIDFCRAEDMQVSLDVAFTEDYLDGDWVSNDLYIPKSVLRERFTRLTDEDEKKATIWHARKPADSDANPGVKDGEGQFTKSGAAGLLMNGDKPVDFVKVIEKWDKRDGMVKTMVDGLERWAVEPYPPPQASTRFYPYFRLAFFEVDGSRHPQSLSYRLFKLQDEYSGARSSGKLTRQRSIPGLIFNAGQVSAEDMKKITDSVHMENIPVTLTNAEFPLQNAIIQKPVPKVDPSVFDTTAVRGDMEMISGVQEAQQGTIQVEKTAREATIEQSGFNARTNANRDCLEDVLTELAQYTAETALQEITVQYATRIAGPGAFWPGPDPEAGTPPMDVQDLLTLVEVDIQGGTTGKPNAEAERSSWATILPMLQKLMGIIRQVEATDPALAEAYRNLLKETLRRMDDRLDIDLFIPTGPPPPPMLPAPGAGPQDIGAPNPGQGDAMPLPADTGSPV